MSRRKRILIIGLAASVVAGGLFLLLRPREPDWEGRSLSEWLGDLGSGASLDQEARTAAAIRGMGQKTLPTLVRLLRRRDSSVKKFIHEIQPRATGSRFPGIEFKWARDSWLAAAQGFEVLGPAAAPAIPELAPLVAEEIPGKFAALSLTAIGPSAVPTLTNLLVQPPACFNAAFALAGMSDVGRAHLLVALTHTNHFVRMAGVAGLFYAQNAPARGSGDGTGLNDLNGRVVQFNAARISAASGFHAGRETSLIGWILDRQATNRDPDVVTAVQSVRRQLGP